MTSLSSSSSKSNSSHTELSVEDEPLIRNSIAPMALMSESTNEKGSIKISPTETSSAMKEYSNRERVSVRSFALPSSLKNLKADLMASSSSKLSKTSSSNTNAQPDLNKLTAKKRSAPGVLPRTGQSPPWQAPPRAGVRSREGLKKESCNEQQEEGGQEIHRNRNSPLHRPHKQQRSISPSTRSNSTTGGLIQQQKDSKSTIEGASSCSGPRGTPPPLWTEGFAKGVTKSVKRAVDDIIFQGCLQNAPKRKFWSSLKPQDILRLTPGTGGNEEKEDDDILGSGSFSKVTKVHIAGKGVQHSNSLFALKRLKGDLLPSKITEHSCRNGSVIAFTKAATELAREAFLLSRFDHPHIINIMGWTEGGVTSYAAYRRHDAYFLVLELLQEETLDDRIEGWNQDDAHLQAVPYSKDRLKEHFHQRKIEQLTICKQVASALAYIHSKNVVYRDLKPQNIGFAREIDKEDQDYVNVKLMDFGLARELPSGGTIQPASAFPGQHINVRYQTSQNKSPSLFDMTGTVGTIRYMAPEVCLNQPYGLECDIYSWSIVSHEILSQTKPFDDMTPDMYQSMVCQQGVRPHPQNMPSEYMALLTQAWRTNPSKRLPFNRIQRQLDLFLQRENLMWEAQELLSEMPAKSESPTSLSQSYSDEKMGPRNSQRQKIAESRTRKRSWYRANADGIRNRTSHKNHIFPNISMDYHVENPVMTGYHQNNFNHSVAENAFLHDPSQQQRRYVTSLPSSSRLPEPVTPDRQCNGQEQQHHYPQQTEDWKIHNDYYNDCNYNYNHSEYHHSSDSYNHHNRSHCGNLARSPSHEHGHWTGGYYY